MNLLVTYGLDQEMNWQSSRQGEYLECDLLLQVRRSRRESRRGRRLYGPLPFVKTACVGYRKMTARLYSAH